MSETPQDDSEKNEPAVTKKRKWLRRLLILIVLLLIASWLFNGICARWLIEDQLTRAFKKQGLTGSAEITGSLVSGFSIKNANYAGSQGIQKMQVGEATIDYSAEGLLNKKIDRIYLKDATFKIDVAKFPPSDKPKDKKDTTLRGTLEKIRPWVINPEINLVNIDVTLLKNDEPLAAFQLGEMVHSAGSDAFQLTSFAAQDGQSRSTPNQDILLTWQENSATLDRWEVLPNIAMADAKLDWEHELQTHLNLELHDARLSAHVAEEITLTLDEGSIESTKIEETLKIKIPAGFSIDSVNVNINDWKQATPLWKINADIGVPAARYGNYTVTNSIVKLEQTEAEYILKLDTELSESPINAKISGAWLDTTSKQWWSNTNASYQISSPALGDIPDLWKHDSSKVDLSVTQIDLSGKIELLENKLTSGNVIADISGATTQGQSLPPLHIQSDYSDNKASLTASVPDSENREFHLSADFDNSVKTYGGNLSLTDTNPEWVNALLQSFGLDINLDSEVKLSWKGQGNLAGDQIHDGEFSVEKLFLNLPNTPTLDIDTQGRYTWPTAINIDVLNIRESQWNATTSVIWNGQNVIIPALVFKNTEEAILGGSASIPLTKDTLSAKTFFAQKDEWNVTLKTQPLAFTKLSDWFKFSVPDGIRGKTDIYLELSGAPSDPRAYGSLNLNQVTGFTATVNRPINARFNFESIEDKLKVFASVDEGKAERINMNGLFPFTPNEWINQPGLFINSIKESPITGNVNINQFPLSELSDYVPKLETIEGAVSGTGQFEGTINNPSYSFDIQAKIPTLKLSEKTLGTIKDVQLDVNITEELVLSNQFVAQINGGKFEVSGDVDINDLKNPIFDITLETQYAMVYRDDLLSTRANADLKLKGSMQEATISGKIGIVESLIYKDIELIPIGVPSSEVAKVKLPSVSRATVDNGFPIPAPFRDWKLDVTLLTEDPILLRGNVAKGYVQGSLKVTGDLARPAPSGTLYVKNMTARLPFSLLTVDDGELIFTPDGGIIPKLNLVGTSTIGSYDVNLLIYGSASSPKTSFTSSPPLPESEIMSLLATGATTTDLGNGNVAAFKAFQILLMKAQQSNQIPGGNSLFKALLTSMKNVNLNVGEVDNFTGRKYSSAKINLNKNWYLTAQVDDKQQTRGLVVYVLRFR